MNKLKDIENFNYDIDYDNLVDIQDVCVEKSLSKDKRIAEYIRQIKNPCCYKCGDFIVIAKYSDDGVSLEERLQSILS